MRWFGLFCWIGICFAVAGAGGYWTAAEVRGWYRTLARPSYAPPDWLFGPVWSLLYLAMGIAAWLVWEMPASADRSWGLELFVAQLALNLAWTWIFFVRHWLGAALAEIVGLLLAIAATTLVFSRVSSLAAWLLVPYLAWVSFATLLNFGFWRLNRPVARV